MVQGQVGGASVVPVMIRMPEDLRERIKAAAKANGQSQNGEIVAALEDRYPASPVEVCEVADQILDFMTELSADERSVLMKALPHRMACFSAEDQEVFAAVFRAAKAAADLNDRVDDPAIQDA
ncbi:Arc family DNA-binding protein [Paracoccus sp. SSJ]|uniref:Arc family DNA-binding protein n=1 Tax=Paracoccus sp. SSJ TaxID=3050636 RepID=UPI00255071EA|nr:Arc family DNA-binding protein [Paracoccus sp. SSJ]MDK8875514.1 Arc family DNA-binding protein [Paracoccus sp. SSJ]